MVKLFRDRVYECLFEGRDESSFTPQEQRHVQRLRALFTYWLDKPSAPRSVLVEWMINEFGVEKSKAYADISLVEGLLGNVRNASRQWARYVVAQTLLEAIERAREANRPDGMIRGAEALIRAFSLDKADEVEIDDAKMHVSFEPTDDIRVLYPNQKPITRREVEQLRERLLANTGVTDVPYDELP